MPKGFHLSPFFLTTQFDVQWKDVQQWGQLDHGDELFHHFLDAGIGLMWSATDAFWASRCTTLIEAQLLVVDQALGKHSGWMGLANTHGVEGALDILHRSIESPAKGKLRKELVAMPGWDDRRNLIPGKSTYEQYGFCMMIGFGFVRKIATFIQSQHREIPRYIGGAMRLGGAARARQEIDALFASLDTRPHNRTSVIEALIDSRLDKKLYLGHLTRQERGHALGSALGF